MTQDEDLLSLPRPKWEHHEIAILGGQGEDDLQIAGGYLTAAETIARKFFDTPDDGLALPVLFLYRHSIELSLKWLIRVAARCALRDGYKGQENLAPAAVNEKLITHNIQKLMEQLNRYLKHLSKFGRYGPHGKLDAASTKLLKWLDSEDRFGDTYRYAVIGKGPDSTKARPTQENINFYEQVNELHKLAILLQAGYSTELYEYEQMQLSGY
ncbi:hypothetical protein [Streptomyces sp. SPB4]|uniref:hypothetical protein n=1 Tax=Streptomyces sp. SPB4 TaxID=2940553 RepID=UPI002473A24C|nr:hypothetical protein [Streptomyces sp. SPB4]MDH6544951.1 hypothetical protein [Streptomyces sp. SPB4]